MARAELESLQSYFASNTAALSAPPVNLDVLAESVNLWKKLVEERASVEAHFEPLQDKYKTLEKFEVRRRGLGVWGLG
jgi:dynein heavy chain